MIGLDHPFELLYQLLFSERSMVVQFSKYIYEKDSLFDERVVLDFQSRDITRENVQRLLDSLNEKEELALHSKLKFNRKKYHIPCLLYTSPSPRDS